MILKLIPFLQIRLPRDAKAVQSPAEITGAAHEPVSVTWVFLTKQCTKPFKADVAQFCFHNVTLFELTW